MEDDKKELKSEIGTQISAQIGARFDAFGSRLDRLEGNANAASSKGVLSTTSGGMKPPKYYPSPTKEGGGDAYDGANDDDDENDEDEDDEENEDGKSRSSKLRREKRRILSRILRQLESSLDGDGLITAEDLRKIAASFNGLPLLTATGQMMIRKCKNKGVPNKYPEWCISEVLGDSDGPTFKEVTVALPRSLDELDIFIKQQIALVTDLAATGGMPLEEALVAVQEITGFQTKFRNFFRVHLGQEGPTLGGGSHQWTDWLVAMLLFYTIWNTAVMQKDFRILKTAFHRLSGEARDMMSRAQGSEDPPILNLEVAMRFAEFQCPHQKCCSIRAAGEGICFDCPDKRITGLVKTEGGDNPLRGVYKVWKEKFPDNAKLPKPESDKKFDEWKTEQAKKPHKSSTPKLSNYAEYLRLLSLRQDLIGHPDNLVGRPPQSVVKKAASRY